MTCKNEYNNVPMYFSSGISTIFGYSDADWKFNMGTKARNAFWKWILGLRQPPGK
jgi:hypothetical protein